MIKLMKIVEYIYKIILAYSNSYDEVFPDDELIIEKKRSLICPILNTKPCYMKLFICTSNIFKKKIRVSPLFLKFNVLVP